MLLCVAWYPGLLPPLMVGIIGAPYPYSRGRDRLTPLTHMPQTFDAEVERESRPDKQVPSVLVLHRCYEANLTKSRFDLSFLLNKAVENLLLSMKNWVVRRYRT